MDHHCLQWFLSDHCSDRIESHDKCRGQVIDMYPKSFSCCGPGGTNVSGALIIPPEERRAVVSLDLSEMDQILWVDEENLVAHVQAGIIGQDLERKVSRKAGSCGFTYLNLFIIFLFIFVYLFIFVC